MIGVRGSNPGDLLADLAAQTRLSLLLPIDRPGSLVAAVVDTALRSARR